MDTLGREYVSLDEFVERHQHRRAGADVIRHGRDPKFRAILLMGIPAVPISVRSGAMRPVTHISDAQPVRFPFRQPLAQPLAQMMTIGAKYWSEWQDLNLRPPRPERVLPLKNLMISV